MASIAFIKNKETSFWTVEEVGIYLKYIDLGDYSKIFTDNQITGEDFLELDNQDLAILGVKVLGHRKRILKNVNKLKSGELNFDNLSDSSVSSASSFSSHGSTGLERVKDQQIQDSSELVLKCYYKKKILILIVQKNTTISNIKRKIKRELHRTVTISYEDEDGDIISLKKDSQLKTAIKSCRDNSLRIHCKRSQKKKVNVLTDDEKTIMNNAVVSMISINPYGVIIHCNDAACVLFGYEREDIIDKNIKVLMPPIYASKHDDYIKRYRRTGKTKVIGTGRNVIAMDSKGLTFPVHLSLTAEKNKKRHIITGQIRRIENSDKNNNNNNNNNNENEGESSRELSNVVDFEVLNKVEDSVVVIKTDGSIIFFNHAAEELFGYEKDEIIGDNVSNLMPSPHRENHQKYINNYLRTGRAKVIGTNREVIIEKEDGNIQAVNLYLEEKVDNDNNKVFVGVITKRKVIKSKKKKSFLKQERERINMITVPAIITDSEGIIQAYNQDASDFFGYSMVDVLGKNVSLLCGGNHKDNHDQYLKNYLESGVAKVIGKSRDVPVLCSDGNEKIANLTITERLDKEKNKVYFVGMFHATDE